MKMNDIFYQTGQKHVQQKVQKTITKSKMNKYLQEKFKCYEEKPFKKILSKTFNLNNQLHKSKQLPKQPSNKTQHKRYKTQLSQPIQKSTICQNQQDSSLIRLAKINQVSTIQKLPRQQSQIFINQYKNITKKYHNRKSLSLFMLMKNNQRKQISLKKSSSNKIQQNLLQAKKFKQLNKTYYENKYSTKQLYNINIINDRLKTNNKFVYLGENNGQQQENAKYSRKVQTSMNFSDLNEKETSRPNASTQQPKYISSIKTLKKILTPINQAQKNSRIKNHIFIPILAKRGSIQNNSRVQNLVNQLQNQKKPPLNTNKKIKLNHSLNMKTKIINQTPTKKNIKLPQQKTLNLQKHLNLSHSIAKAKQNFIGRIKKQYRSQTQISDISRKRECVFTQQSQQLKQLKQLKIHMEKTNNNSNNSNSRIKSHPPQLQFQLQLQKLEQTSQQEQKTVKIYDNVYRKQKITFNQTIHQKLLKNQYSQQEGSQQQQEQQRRQEEGVKKQQKQDGCNIF